MFNNFKFNLDGLIYFLVANIFIVADTFICIQYGIEGIDKLLLFVNTGFAIGFITKALKKWGL